MMTFGIFLGMSGCGPKEEEPPEDDGEPAEGDPCLVDEGCASPLFCAADGCLEQTQGTCILTADLDCASEAEDPVCGCDGETYANRCEAHQKRRNIEYARPCATP
jgi:hypothetical protein